MKMKFNLSQNVVCLVETALLTGLYAALLFAGVKLLFTLV
jgi:hypothetical protein